MKVTYGMGFTVTLVFDSALQRARWMASQGILSDLQHSDIFRVAMPEIPYQADSADEQAPSTPHNTGSSQFTTNERVEQALQNAIPSDEVQSETDPSDAVEPTTVSDADLDFPTDYTPTGDGGFFDPSTGEVFETLPSDADRERTRETPTLPSSPPTEANAASSSPSWDTEKWGTLGPPPSAPIPSITEPLEDGKIEDGKVETKRKAPKSSAAERTIPLPHVPLPDPVPNTGSLPVHVISDLGQHPAITPAVDRSVFVQRAIEDKLLDASFVESQPEAAWIALQYKAPAGWMKKVRESAAAITPALPGEIENMGALVTALEARGFPISLITVAGWTPAMRNHARAFLRGEVSDLDFFP